MTTSEECCLLSRHLRHPLPRPPFSVAAAGGVVVVVAVGIVVVVVVVAEKVMARVATLAPG